MRIVCPSCQAAYEVPETLLRAEPGAAPRKVKCARCAHAWAPEVPPPEVTPVAEAIAAPAPARPAALAAPAPAAPPDEPPPPAPPPAPESAPVAALVPAAAPALEHMAAPTAAPVPRVAEKLAPADPPSEVARGPGLVPVALAWVASLAVLGGAAWAALRWREAVMAAWGPSRRVYELLGLM